MNVIWLIALYSPAHASGITITLKNRPELRFECVSRKLKDKPVEIGMAL